MAFGGVGCNSIVELTHMVDATQQISTDGVVGWGVIASLNVHTWSMLRNRWGGGVGWGVIAAIAAVSLKQKPLSLNIRGFATCFHSGSFGAVRLC